LHGNDYAKRDAFAKRDRYVLRVSVVISHGRATFDYRGTEITERENLPMSDFVIAVVDDLFFASKIRGAGEQAGVRIIFAKTILDVIKSATDDRPALIIADMNSQRCDPLELAARLKKDKAFCSIPLLGFFSHVQTELQQAARAAGFDQVVPRSVFAKNLPEILAKGQMK